MRVCRHKEVLRFWLMPTFLVRLTVISHYVPVAGRRVREFPPAACPFGAGSQVQARSTRPPRNGLPTSSGSAPKGCQQKPVGCRSEGSVLTT
jgi:hypothetical protein